MLAVGDREVFLGRVQYKGRRDCKLVVREVVDIEARHLYLLDIVCILRPTALGRLLTILEFLDPLYIFRIGSAHPPLAFDPFIVVTRVSG
eukprot:5782365-Prymnesium_polylepis.1